MKTALFSLLISFSCFFMFSQELPTLNLSETVSQDFEFPITLSKNDIGVILHLTGGWSAYDHKSYYIFKDSGDVILYNRKFPKSYLRKKKALKDTLTKIELTTEQKQQVVNKLNASTTLNFLKYSQHNFKTISATGPPVCMISDATGYNFAIIQDGKVNSYKYYAPDHSYNNCNDKNINKVVLGQYIALIDFWFNRKK
ncbi:hypothetical protein [Psychroserpens damuponensis]|uniref:hypothetical protein n=1 Tax=Psychroserpens damuponensis TaxID=943936 RepID=UPI00058E71C6|nr:hypothetical protein [Psychroserpens damuponensis]